MTLAAKDEISGLLGAAGEDVLPILDDNSEPLDLDKLTAFLEADVNPQRVIVDSTASEEVASYYERWLEAGISVICPSKVVASGPIARYDAVAAKARKNSGAKWQYESSVGAALPVLTTLQDLISTGDEVKEITGCLSGTMAYTLRTQAKDKTFTEAFLEAHLKGYTEPDVREDLSGIDMARKVVILARELGIRLEVDDVVVHSFLPTDVANKIYTGTNTETAEAALADLRAAGVDDDMHANLVSALDDGMVLRYSFRIDVPTKTCEITLQPMGSDQPLFRLKKNENLVSFKTRRYSSSPLIVKGSAAGAELASSGIFADLLRLTRSLS